MKINKDTRTNDLNDAFISLFPYLKLSFYKKSHDHFHGSEKQDEFKEVVSLGTLNPEMNEGEITWQGEMSVDQLETYFETTFGLHVQVFRKSGDIWLQTSATDHWTLNEQNNHGAESENFASK